MLGRLRSARRRTATANAASAGSSEDPAQVGIDALFITILVVYWILLGGTEAGISIPVIRALNAAFAAVVIGLLLLRIHEGADAIDLAAFGMVGAFAVASVLSVAPRASVDALTASVGWVSALYLGRRLAYRPEVRRFLIFALALVAAVLAITFLIVWSGVWLEWLSLTGLQSWPPLTADLPTLVFRHPHSLALLLLLLAPALIYQWRVRWLRPLVVIGLVGTTFVVVSSGSRTNWVAAGVATAVLLATTASGRHAWAWLTAHWRPAIAVGAVMAVMTVLSGAAEPLVARATTIRTLGARGEIWEAAIGLWASHPTTGTGPGTFVLALPLSGYFETNGFPPRHADSAPIQLLAEAGIIGLIAGLALVIMVIRGLIRSSPALALWPLLLFSFASLTDNPSDTPGIVAVAVAWVAVALPTRRVVANAPSSWLRITMFSAGLVVLATYSAFSIAHVAHETGIAHARAGRLHAAESAFEVAVAFDPAMALYRRDLGLVDLSRGEVAEATHSLQEAVRLSPTDPASHRAYAAALLDSGNPDLAYDVMESVVRWHPSQANLVFAALAAEANSVDSQGFLSRAVVLNPLLPGAPTWHTLFGDSTTVYELAEAAAGSSTYRLSYQPLWLSILSGKSGQVDERESLAASARLLKTGRAWSALLSCRLEESLADIRAAQHREGEDEVYWLTRLVVESANGESRPSTVRLAFLLNRRLTDAILAQGSESGTVLDPMGDLRMYGRNGLWDLPGLPRVPTGAEAWRAWIEEPVSTAVRTVPTSGLAQCQGRTVSH